MISVVICSADPAKFERVSRMYGRAMAGASFEIVGVHDARSLAEGYNRGVDRARGDVIVFSHDDIELLGRNLPGRIERHLHHYDLLGIAGATRLESGQWVVAGPPHVYGQAAVPNRAENVFDVFIWNNARRAVGGIKAMDGVFLVAKRAAARAIPFDERTFDRFHLYDIDFTFRAFLAGFRQAVCCDIPLIHDSGGVFDEGFYEQHERFLRKHGPRLDSATQRIFRICTVKIPSADRLLEVMTPPHWNEPEAGETE